MSIRRRLLLSYLGFITLFVVGVILAFDLFGIDCISRAVLQASTESLDRLTAALKDKGATVVGRLMVFRSAPNDEANYSAADNEAAGLRRARALGETLGSQLRSALAP